MSVAKKLATESHVVDILGSTKGRDQPIMLVEKALLLVSNIDQNLILDPNTVFLDPFCKAGEVLLAMAMHCCSTKKKRQGVLLSTDEIVSEIYGGHYFAMAPDERHFLLSLRTFYGNQRSHIQDLKKNILNGNYLSETDGRLNQEKFKEELSSMIEFIKKSNRNAKIVAVGNPPYQEADEGFGGSASAIYNHFVEALMDCEDIQEFTLVIPSRWFSAGKGTEKFRERILASKNIKAIRHFKQSKEVFPTVDVLGGVCFMHYNRSHNGNTKFIEGKDSCQISLSKYDIIPDDPKAYPLVEKIIAKSDGKFVSDIAWAGKPFGIRTFYFKRNGGGIAKSEASIPCYSKGRKIKYIAKSEVTKNLDKINHYKIAVPRAYAPGSKMGVRRVTLPVDQYFMISKGEITAETYNIVGSFETKREAENFLTYLQTDFARYFLGLRKITQDIPKDRWNWVPLLSMDKEWTDSKLFEYFKLTKDEQAHIRRKVQEWS